MKKSDRLKKLNEASSICKELNRKCQSALGVYDAEGAFRYPSVSVEPIGRNRVGIEVDYYPRDKLRKNEEDGRKSVIRAVKDFLGESTSVRVYFTYHSKGP